MKTKRKGQLGCLLLIFAFVAYSVGAILVLGSSHPAPGTPVRSTQFTIGLVLTLMGMAAFLVGAFFGLTAGLEWLVYGRRRALRPTHGPEEAISAPSSTVPMSDEGDTERQTVR